MSRRQVVRRQIQGALLAAAALMLAPQAATAQYRPNCRGYEQYQPCPRCQPYQPEYAPHRPGDLPEVPGKEGAKKPREGERPERQPEQPEQPNLQGADTAPSVAQAEGYSSSNSSILGRVDQNNRLNLFDSMSAMPQNRVWATYLPEKRYHTCINVAESLYNGVSNQALLHERLSQELYRVGAEMIVHPGVSVAVQGQFSNINGNEGGYDDVFTNPQIMLKAVLACDCCSILSATFGVQPEVGTEDPEHPGINETSTRLYPGLLYFQDLGDGWFMQDGIQFGVPVEDNQITTFDWAISLGNWIYRDPCLDRSSCCCCCCQRPTILGVIAQVELFGKHVLGDRRIEDVFGVEGLVFEEDGTVIDLTAGFQVLCDGGCWVSIAASIPITTGDVKELEGIVTVGHRW
jgi:hypothetical protein